MGGKGIRYGERFRVIGPSLIEEEGETQTNNYNAPGPVDFFSFSFFLILACFLEIFVQKEFYLFNSVVIFKISYYH